MRALGGWRGWGGNGARWRHHQVRSMPAERTWLRDVVARGDVVEHLLDFFQPAGWLPQRAGWLLPQAGWTRWRVRVGGLSGHLAGLVVWRIVWSMDSAAVRSFFVGDVVDDLGRSRCRWGGRRRGGPLRLFLSAEVRATSFGGSRAGKRVKGAEGEDEVGHAGEVRWGDGAACETKMKGCDCHPRRRLRRGGGVYSPWLPRWRGPRVWPKLRIMRRLDSCSSWATTSALIWMDRVMALLRVFNIAFSDSWVYLLQDRKRTSSHG